MSLPRPAASPGRPALALGLLTLVYVVNFVDRQLISIVGQPMKAELGLGDLQYGLLGGTAFALFYTALALPIARLADRGKRVRIVAISLAIWSAATALCGTAGNFAQLLLARVGVGVGEAGCAPVSQSVVSDLFPADRRATALSLLSLGIPLGMLVAGTIGSTVAQAFGWRTAFVAFGLPGVLLAVAIVLLLPEPARGASDAAPAADTPSFADVVRTLARSRPFLHMAAGASLASFAGYGVTYFAVPLLVRAYRLSLAQAGSGFGIEAGVAIGIGIAGGGWLSDRLARQRPDAPAIVAAVGAMAAAVLFDLALVQDSVSGLAVMAAVPLAAAHLYFGPTYAVTVNSVGPRERATAIALLLAIMTAIGLGLGPLTVGALSDFVADATLPGFARLCGARLQDPLCAAASSTGLIGALGADMLMYIWAATHFVLAGRALRALSPRGGRDIARSNAGRR